MSRVDAVLGLNTQPFQQGLAQARGSLQSFSSGAQSGIKSWAAGLSFVGLAAGVKSLIAEFDRLGDLAQRFDLSGEDLQRIGYAAKQSGTDIEQVAKAMGLANRTAQEAARGNKQYAESYERLGISAKSFAAADQIKQLMMLADAYNEATDKNAALADVQKILGRSSGELVPLLSQGSEAIRQMGEAAVVVSNETLELIRMTDDLAQSMGGNLKAQLGQMVGQVAGGLMGLWEMIKETGAAFKDLFRGDFESAMKRNLGDAFTRPLWEAAEKTIDAIQHRKRGVLAALEEETTEVEKQMKRQEEAFKSFYDARAKDIPAEKYYLEKNQEAREAAARKAAQGPAKRERSVFENWVIERGRREQDELRNSLSDRIGNIDSAISRVSGTDSLQSIGLGLAGVNYGRNPVVSGLEKTRTALVAKLEEVVEAIEENEYVLREDEF